MVNMTELLIEEAYAFAKKGRVYEALAVIEVLHIYGVSSKEVAKLIEDVGLTYLKETSHPVLFGLVERANFFISTIYDYTQYDHAYIGLSPHARPTFEVKNPTYKEYGNSHEVLVSLDGEWFYGNFTQYRGEDDFYCGQVVSATKGRLQVIPYFATAETKDLALDAIRGLKGADYHVWELPENFNMVPSEYETTQQAQTALALAHYGLT